MRKPRNVYRIDIAPTEEFPHRHPTHGWQVRIRRAGVQNTKFFSDDKHGKSSAQALEAAVKYRDELMPSLPPQDSPTMKSAAARTKTGVIGLSFCTKDDGSGKAKPYVQLSWTAGGGKRETASYSVEKWGLRKAIWNAVVRLHREHQSLGRDVIEPQEMFNTAYAKITTNYPQFAEAEDATS